MCDAGTLLAPYGFVDHIDLDVQYAELPVLRAAATDGTLDNIGSVWIEVHEDLKRRSPVEFAAHPCSERTDFSQLEQIFSALGWRSRFRCRVGLKCIVGGRHVQMLGGTIQGFQLWLNPRYLSKSALALAADATVDDGMESCRRLRQQAQQQATEHERHHGQQQREQRGGASP